MSRHTVFIFCLIIVINNANWTDTASSPAGWSKVFEGKTVIPSVDTGVYVAESIESPTISIEMDLNFPKRKTVPILVVNFGRLPGAAEQRWYWLNAPKHGQSTIIRLSPEVRSDFCVYEKDPRKNLTVRCVGKLGFRSGKTEKYNIVMYVLKPLPIAYRFRLSIPDESCQDVTHPYCHHFYRQTAFPNTIGHSSQQQVYRAFPNLKMVINLIQILKCYQHIRYIACLIAFPRCDNGIIRIPCHEMCREAAAGCFLELKSYNLAFGCSTLESKKVSDTCIYKEVNCGEPPIPKWGNTYYNATTAGTFVSYSCNEGYEVEGDTRRKCAYSGHWEGKTPVCRKITWSKGWNVNVEIGIAIVCAVLGVIIILTIFAYNFKEKILLQCYAKFGVIDKSAAKDYKYHAFICFHKNETDFILKEVIPNLEEKAKPPYQLCIHLRDFEPGETIVGNITNSIRCSYKTVIFLSMGYLGSEWCQCEFQLAHYEVINGRSDFLILVLMDDLDETKLSADVKAYMSTHTYIKYSKDTYFWKRLAYALKKPITLEGV